MKKTFIVLAVIVSCLLGFFGGIFFEKNITQGTEQGNTVTDNETTQSAAGQAADIQQKY